MTDRLPLHWGERVIFNRAKKIGRHINRHFILKKNHTIKLCSSASYGLVVLVVKSENEKKAFSDCHSCFRAMDKLTMHSFHNNDGIVPPREGTGVVVSF